MINIKNDNKQNILIYMIGIIILSIISLLQNGKINIYFLLPISFYLISFLMKLLVKKLTKNKENKDYFHNIFHSVILLIYAIVYLIIIFVTTFWAVFVIKTAEIDISALGISYTHYIYEITKLIVILVMFLHSIHFFRYDPNNYYRIPFLYILLSYDISALLYAVSLREQILLPYPVILLFYVSVTIPSLVGIVNYFIVLINLGIEKNFFKFTIGVKIFVIDLFKKKMAYYIGIGLLILIGSIYLIAGIKEKFYMHIGALFLLISLLRIINEVWAFVIRNKERNKRYFNYYIMIYLNSLYLFGIFYIFYKVLQSAVNQQADSIGFFTVVQIIILIVRIVIASLGYYNSRINVKVEPNVIATNNISIISIILAAIAFIIPFLKAVGVGNYDIVKIFNVINIIALSLLALIIIIMPIRATIGLVKLKKEEMLNDSKNIS